MRLRNVRVGAVGLVLAGSLVACGGNKATSNTSAEPGGGAGTPAGQKVDTATAGDVKGAVALDGTAPRNEAIKMNADPVCVKEGKGTTTEFILTGDGGALQNVFVYVKDGLGNRTFPTPSTSVILDQKGCHYRPHVFGIMVGQPLEIVNSDPTLHNIHALPKGNQEFNTGQPIQGMKTAHTFTAKEVMVPFKCDVHGWMNAYVGVMSNPYFAVTEKDGKFDLPNLPPGTYTIEAWHEKLGTQEQKVTLGQKETKDITFTFKAGAPTTTNN